ncbi:MAG: right-handed parallel beta-helix repeat-containing protein, partial [Armatimonadota bacterium]
MYSSRVTLLNVVGVVASVVACSLCSGTNLPAEITSDQTWRYDESPYHLTRDTTIAEGVTVTVEAGVEVLVDGNFELRVEGRLLVAGSDHYKVFFVPTDRDAVGVWRGIFVTMDGHVEMVSAVIRGAMTNIINAGGFVQMNNCYIERAQNDGMFVFGPAWIGLVRCYFNHNGRRGLYIETTEPEGNVWRSRFIANGEYPVYTKATCAEILKRGNRYHFNGKDFIGVCCSAQDDITDVDGWYTQGGVQYDLTAGAGSHELRVSGILLIDKGVAIRASSIDVTGRIDTNGSMEHPVTILPPGDDPKPG